MGTWSCSGLLSNQIPTEMQVVEAFRKQFAENGLALLYCRLTMTKTFLGTQWGRRYYKIDCLVEDCVFQAGATYQTLTIIALVLVIAFLTFGLFLACGGINILYKIMGMSPDEVSKYNDANAKLWGALTGFVNSIVALVGFTVAGFGAYIIFSSRRKEKKTNDKGR